MSALDVTYHMFCEKHWTSYSVRGATPECPACTSDARIAALEKERDAALHAAEQRAIDERAAVIERDEARAELETERLRLAGCGVAAVSNTPRTVAERIARSNPHWSSSYADVCAAVDREMDLRAQLSAMQAERDAARAALQHYVSNTELTRDATTEIAFNYWQAVQERDEARAELAMLKVELLAEEHNANDTIELLKQMTDERDHFRNDKHELEAKLSHLHAPDIRSDLVGMWKARAEAAEKRAEEAERKSDEYGPIIPRAQVALDMHDSLGVKWGHNPYQRIKELLLAEKRLAEAVEVLRKTFLFIQRKLGINGETAMQKDKALFNLTRAFLAALEKKP